MKRRMEVAILLAVLFTGNVFGFDPFGTLRAGRLTTNAAFSQQKPEKHLMRCPASSESSTEIFNRAAYETRAKEKAIDNLVTETASNDIEQIQTGLSVIDISSNITSNTIWTSNNTYHILVPIEVNGAMLVIEPGTTVTFAGGGTMASIRILNGGALIARGTPDNPILFTSDSSTPWYGDYYCPAYIEETASETTRITYCIVEWAYSGIALSNIDLDTDIENNYFFNCLYGIVEYGTSYTDIINNLCFSSYYSGIYVSMESLSGASDANGVIKIQNNTCDWYQDYGISIHGAADGNNVGLCIIVNNLVSNARLYGLHLANGHISSTVTNTGYYGNAGNKNWDFPENNPVEAFDDPYVYGSGDCDICYLNQSCPFIDAGLEYVEETSLIGKTTNVDGTPDSNKIDIGFHYPNWQFSNAGTTTLQADFDNSLRVDYNDLAFFTDYWLFDYNEAEQIWLRDFDDSDRVDYGDLMVISEYWLEPYDFVTFAWFAQEWQKEVDLRYFDRRADLAVDDRVDFKDFAVLANEWQKTGDAEPNIVPIISGDPNTGYVGISVSEFPSDTKRIVVLADGKYIGTLYGFDGDETLALDISESDSQEHHLKLISISSTGHITCSNITNVAFSCPLNYCVLPSDYESGKSLSFSAFNPGAGNVSVELFADGGISVWSQTYSGTSISGTIPADITSQHILDYMTLSVNPGVSPIPKPINPKIREKEIDPATEALIIEPIIWLDFVTHGSTLQVERAFKQNGIKYTRLSGIFADSRLIAACGQFCSIRYLYVLSHGGYQYDKKGGVLRTRVKLADGVAVSVKRSDFFPYTGPSWCEELEPDLEYSNVFSWAAMGFHSLEFAYFDCCYAGRLKINANNQLVIGQRGHIGKFDVPHSDMSYALGMANTSRDCAFQGWYDQAWYDLFELTPYAKFTHDEWSNLAIGPPAASLDTAIQYAISRQTSFFDPNAPVNTYRLKGHGFLSGISLHHQ